MNAIRWTALAAVLLTFFATAPARAASAVIDDVNGTEIPGFYTFAPNNVGWFYTPSFSYPLDGISSTFRAIPNPAPATRDVTLSVYDDVPDDGGNLLRTGTFSAGPAGGDLGIMFAPLDLTAGESYFIAFDDVGGLGLNIVDFAVSLPLPDNNMNPDIQFLSGWYTDTDFETFHSVDDSPGFAAPILNFHGVPEPTTWALALLGASLVGALVRRRRNAA